MHVEIDITDNDPRPGFGDGTMPDGSMLTDDNDVLLSFGDVTIRMTYAQFDGMLGHMIAWTTSSESERDMTASPDNDGSWGEMAKALDRARTRLASAADAAVGVMSDGPERYELAASLADLEAVEKLTRMGA